MYPLILNVFSTFAVGGPQVRFAALANSAGHHFRHLVFAVDGQYDCLNRLRSPSCVGRSYFDFPRGGIATNVATAHKLLRRLDPALLITYNWGAIEWTLAAALTKVASVHVVDGFGPEEAERQLARRIWFRRLALARCHRVVVPSRTLYKIARKTWHLPAHQITHVPNGVDVDWFVKPPDDGFISRLGIPHNHLVVGTVAALRPEKNLDRLLRAIAMVAEQRPVALVVVGDGALRQSLESQARATGLGDKVIFAGALEDPARILGVFNLFAISSDTEQMPFSVLEAMAAGLPIAGVDVGDVKEMVSDENRPFIVEPEPKALAGSILDLLADGKRRLRVGAANRQRARQDYGLDQMVHSYNELFMELAGPA